ncbi:glycosyltransferase family 4 protein [Roseibium sp. Sym1]|uniref:glycosyltransferase family 4 protein n=1 Tax=Roseibium sp. Sym1 TaxID=3016006 RepID=UPI0022B4AED0|nr:glycosyltransferase family 4 protein [Roseibium sp. Sym1]
MDASVKLEQAVIKDLCSLHRPISKIVLEPGEPPVTQMMYLMWMQRPDLRKQYDLNTKKGRRKLRAWYATHGAIELDLVHWLADCAGAPREHPRSYGELARNLIVHFQPLLFLKMVMTLWRWNGPIVRRTEKLGLTIGLHFRDFLVAGAKRLPNVAQLLRTEELIPAPAAGPGRIHPLLNFSVVEGLDVSEIRAADPGLREKGVNIIGYAYGELGLGEDTRTAARALALHDVPVGVVNFDRGLFTRQQDKSAKQWITNECRYRTNLFPMAVNEAHSAILNIGMANYNRRYNIGYAPWELPKWPKAWMNYLDLLDEFWVSTTFTYNALRPFTDKPVCLMPLAVTIDEVAPVKRSDFGLPDDAFLFFFSFDVTSSVHRKNPFATIEAFKRAFPRGDEPVGLVVKVMNLDPLVPNWHRLNEATSGDDRIHFITGTLARPTLMGLVSSCDAYVSLHRAEGFGRGPAEAMLLGKPTIVTGFSGNLDFTKPDNSCLVDYKLIDVLPHEYHFGEGLQWADPHVDHAAEHMRKLAGDREFAEQLGRAAREQIQTHHSAKAAGDRYCVRLNELGLL